MMGYTLLHVVLVLLVLSAHHGYNVNAQSASQPVAPHALRDNLNPSVAVVVVALVCAFLFVGFFSIYIHHCSDTYLTIGNQVGATVDCSCAPRGIDPELLDTFPNLVYSTIKDLKIGKGALECAVCLSEFRDHETLRLLPKCNHVFHPECIDAWLTSHVTCPVCRAKLKPDSGDQIAIAIPSETNAHEVVDDSSVRRAELGAAEEQPGAPNMNEGQSQRSENVDGSIWKQTRPPKSIARGKLVRSHSTGHSLVEPEKNVERYTLRLPEDVRKHILVNHGGIRRSASYDVILPGQGSSRKGCRNDGEGSSRGNKRESSERQTRRLVLSMTPPFVSRYWASSSCPLHPL